MEKKKISEIDSYEEFVSYYWYLEELVSICKELGIEYLGGKKELNHYIEEYYKGNIIKHKAIKKLKITDNGPLSLETKVVECGFSFNQKFRDFFIAQTNNAKFKFNADMVESVKRAKQKENHNFSLGDLLRIYYGEKEYAKYDKVSCQWNKFLKDFYAYELSLKYQDRFEVARILWNEIKKTDKKKEYSSALLQEYNELIINK